MSQKKVQILAGPQSEWPGFFQEFFEDTAAKTEVISDSITAAREFDRDQPALVFYESGFSTLSLFQKWKAFRTLNPGFRAYQLGDSPMGNAPFSPDACFPSGLVLGEFQRALVKTLPFPETLHVLVTDDEPAIGQMICDFLAQQSRPSFRTDYVQNGAQALQFLGKSWPDVLVLDVKMPLVGGIEVFRALKTHERPLPVIVFFDAVFGDEIEKLHEIGHPAIIEKGSRQSEMPALLSLIKKMAFFG